MARKVNGVSSILRGARLICRMVGRFGVAPFAAETTPAFAAAVTALVVACQAFDALDNYPGEVEHIAPDGPEDVSPVG